MPLSVLRRPSTIDHFCKSKRYGSIVENLNERVERPDFAGYWLCKPRFDGKAPPSEADVVILYIHGGGYVMSQPNQFAAMLLRVAETVVDTGKTVAIFVLDYSLAPESVFPRQLGQASACWEYLTTEQNIPVSNIALMGDSAGGSICLSLLTHLAYPLPSIKPPTIRSAPGRGAFLLSPWVSLFDQSGYSDKADSDLLVGSVLRRWATMAVAGAKRADVESYLEFTTAGSARPGLGQILPEITCVFAGGDELFLENISRFVEAARAAGANVMYDVKAGACHDWQVSESVKNEKKYLALPFGTPDAGLLSGADAIGKKLSSFVTGMS